MIVVVDDELLSWLAAWHLIYWGQAPQCQGHLSSPNVDSSIQSDAETPR